MAHGGKSSFIMLVFMVLTIMASLRRDRRVFIEADKLILTCNVPY
jgi:hypothetical protein